MIKPVGSNVTAIDTARLRESGKTRGPSVAGAVTSLAAGSATPAARMAAQGAPVDLDRIAAIKSAIAAGNYPVDADAIADRMMALDLPIYG